MFLKTSLGHPEADVSLFSFGSIKYNTALGGCLAVVRNDDVLYRKMKHIQDQYPMQPTNVYLKKCLKMVLPAYLLNDRLGNFLIRDLGRKIDKNFGEFGVSLVRYAFRRIAIIYYNRGFPKDGDFLSKFRFQVCTPLLANLAYRCETLLSLPTNTP